MSSRVKELIVLERKRMLVKNGRKSIFPDELWEDEFLMGSVEFEHDGAEVAVPILRIGPARVRKRR